MPAIPSSRRRMEYSGPMEPQFVSLSDLDRFTLAKGVSAQALFGEGVMLNLVELAPDALVPGTAILTSSSAGPARRIETCGHGPRPRVPVTGPRSSVHLP